MPLSFQEFQTLHQKGLSPEQIASFESGKVPLGGISTPKPNSASKFVDIGIGNPNQEGIVNDIVQNTLGSRGAAGLGKTGGQAVGGFLADAVTGGRGNEFTAEGLSHSLAGLADQTTAAIKRLKTQTDPGKKASLMRIIQSNLAMLSEGNSHYNNLIDETGALQTAGQNVKQVAGQGLNTALTGLGGEGNFVQDGALAATKGTSLLRPVAKVMQFGGRVVPRAAESSLLSGGFQVASNLQDNKPLSENLGTATAIGAVIPFAGTALSAIKEKATPAIAKAFVNSLIKPLPKTLRYGADPAKGVLEDVGAFTSLEDGKQKILNARQYIGKQIRQVLTSPIAQKKGVTLIGVTQPLDDAIEQASKGGEVNDALIKRLQNAKDAITKNFKMKNGVNQAVGERQLAYLSPEEAFNVKQIVADITKFTGNPSDDETVNSALKQVYGRIKGKINEAVPEVVSLNERYANLATAENAIKRQASLAPSRDLISLGAKLMGGGGIVAGAATLNPALIAAGVASFGVDKLFSSSIFKTNFANFLYKASKVSLDKVGAAAPELANMIDRTFGGKKKPTLPQIKQEIELLRLPAPEAVGSAGNPMRMPQFTDSQIAEQRAASGVVKNAPLPKRGVPAYSQPALPAPPIYGSAPNSSEVGLIKAKKLLPQRNPKTGRMQTVYSSLDGTALPKRPAAKPVKKRK